MIAETAARSITLSGISKAYGETVVIEDLSAEMRGGEFTVVLGPSGCGKSTLLNMIAGLEHLDRGTIGIGAREVQALSPKDRGCAMVFQNYALYPHMSVAENIGYALKVAGVPRTIRASRVAEAAETVQLGPLLDRRPAQLSGGQRQRVAIARAIVRQPQVLLFDEPLSNLDAKLRHGMRMELSALHRRIGATSVFVTHDQVEAMTLADRVMILNGGRIEQFDTPARIYHRPASAFVAGFIGSPPMNLIDVTGDGTELRLSDGSALAQSPHHGPVTLGMRPERIMLSETGWDAKVIYREDLGSHTVFVAQMANGREVQVATPMGSELAADRMVRLNIHRNDLHLFDTKTGKRLSNYD